MVEKADAAHQSVLDVHSETTCVVNKIPMPSKDDALTILGGEEGLRRKHIPNHTRLRTTKDVKWAKDLVNGPVERGLLLYRRLDSSMLFPVQKYAEKNCRTLTVCRSIPMLRSTQHLQFYQKCLVKRVSSEFSSIEGPKLKTNRAVAIFR